jgi:ATP-dependent helicase HrpB
MQQFPVDAVLPDVRKALASHAGAVLVASPGAGKTTRVPLALLDEPWLRGQRIVMLEPRRLAARNAATYMAQQRGDAVGGLVGYRIRGESKVGKETRLEIVTEGILTRMLQDDAALTGIGAVIFDEFHERSIHADLGLALTLDVQTNLRPELRILIMSATLDGAAVATLLGDAPVIESEGRTFSVDTKYLDRQSDVHIERQVAASILRAIKETEGDILAFLPGQREIHRVKAQLEENELPGNFVVHLLFGELPFERQQAALTRGPAGIRKILLATSIAETSLTIDGVRVVVDAGLARRVEFDPRRGMSGLVTGPVSHAGADQRRGRSGRQSPGVCYRLWTEQQHGQLPPFAKPEITLADLAPLAIEFARWGDPDGSRLRFLDPPPVPHLAQARDLLQRLGAVDGRGALTSHGRAMAALPVHPRFAHMLIKGREQGLGSLACDVAALLEERDILRPGREKDIDFGARYHALHRKEGVDPTTRNRIVEQSKRLRSLIGVKDEKGTEADLGMLLSMAHPERVAKRRDKLGERYQLANGTGALLPRGSLLAREEFLAVADVDGQGNEVRIFLAAPLQQDALERVAGGLISTQDNVSWDERTKAVIARRVRKYGSLELSMQSLVPDADAARRVLLSVLGEKGLEILPWSKDAHSLRVRSEWIRTTGLVDNQWPDLSDNRLSGTMEEWLGPFLFGVIRQSEIDRIDMGRVLRSLLTHKQLQEIELLAPTHLTVPTGSRIPIDYEKGQPVLAVRLQEMFGETKTPTVGGGRVKVLLHLLSPAQRPLAVTQDLPSFWKNAYPDVRKDMRGQYPKHVWPEDPLNAEPTRRAKRRKPA